MYSLLLINLSRCRDHTKENMSTPFCGQSFQRRTTFLDLVHQKLFYESQIRVELFKIPQDPVVRKMGCCKIRKQVRAKRQY